MILEKKRMSFNNNKMFEKKSSKLETKYLCVNVVNLRVMMSKFEKEKFYEICDLYDNMNNKYVF